MINNVAVEYLTMRISDVHKFPHVFSCVPNATHLLSELKDKITELSERQVSSLYIGSVNIVSAVL